MKLLENSKLESISNGLCIDTGDCKIMARYVYIFTFILLCTNYRNSPIHQGFLYYCLLCLHMSYNFVAC